MAKTGRAGGLRKENPGGRKPIEDKKVQVTLYLRPSEITRMGGIDDTREILYGKWEEELGLPHGRDYKSQH